MHHPTGIERALAQFEGSPTKMAKALGKATVQRQHVEHWSKAGRVPAEHAPDVERVTGIPCEQLCPGVNWGVLRGAPWAGPQPEAKAA